LDLFVIFCIEEVMKIDRGCMEVLVSIWVEKLSFGVLENF
jgi:hypothetical protein